MYLVCFFSHRQCVVGCFDFIIIYSLQCNYFRVFSLHKKNVGSLLQLHGPVQVVLVSATMPLLGSSGRMGQFYTCFYTMILDVLGISGISYQYIYTCNEL